jgi:hypothetical protein
MQLLPVQVTHRVTGGLAAGQSRRVPTRTRMKAAWNPTLWPEIGPSRSDDWPLPETVEHSRAKILC